MNVIPGCGSHRQTENHDDDSHQAMPQPDGKPLALWAETQELRKHNYDPTHQTFAFRLRL
jgi:hypothetical protein